MYTKALLTFSTIAALTVMSASTAFASGEVTPTPKKTATPTPTKTVVKTTPTPTVTPSSCEASYGGYGQETCDRVDFIIDKKVADPTTVGLKGKTPSNYQDNFGVNMNKYVPGQEVPFQITVKNTGTKVLTDVVVKDTLPENVTLVSPRANYNESTRELTIEVGTLQPGETKTLYVTARVNAADQLLQDSVFCLKNYVIMHAAGQSDDDEAEFCVTKENVGGNPSESKGGKKVFPTPEVTTTPPTGPELFALIPLMGSAVAGVFLRKKSI